MNNKISSVKVLVTLLALFSLRVVLVKSVNSNDLSFVKRFEVIRNYGNLDRGASFRWVSKRDENSIPTQPQQHPDSASNVDQTSNFTSVESAPQDPIRVATTTTTTDTLLTENVQRNNSELVITTERTRPAELPSGPVLKNDEANVEVEKIVEQTTDQESNSTSLTETISSNIDQAANTQQQLAQQTQLLLQSSQLPSQLPSQPQQETQKPGEAEEQQKPPQEPSQQQEPQSQTEPNLEPTPEPQETPELEEKKQEQSQEIDDKKPDVESVPKTKEPDQVITNEIVATKEIVEPVNNSSSKVEYAEEETFDYKLESSCNFTSIIPDEIITMAVKRILTTIEGEKCSSILDLKLKPMINQRIKGFVMEVSSMPVELDVLTGALSTQVSCSKVEDIEPNKKMKFNMIFTQDLGNKRLESKWRSYSELQHDDIPVRVFDSSIARRGQSKVSSKCQKFKLELGDFYLDLISFKTKLIFEMTFVKLDQTTWSMKESIGGGRILLKSIQINELYLDDKINLDSIGRRKLNIAAPTVQILHDQNNHFRRNNWLLDLYGNWLKHEYKQQILRLLGEATFLGRLNSCFND